MPEARVAAEQGLARTRYGYLTGKVVSVSHDAAQDQQLGLVFPARVKLERGHRLPAQPPAATHH